MTMKSHDYVSLLDTASDDLRRRPLKEPLPRLSSQWKRVCEAANSYNLAWETWLTSSNFSRSQSQERRTANVEKCRYLDELDKYLQMSAEIFDSPNPLRTRYIEKSGKEPDWTD